MSSKEIEIKIEISSLEYKKNIVEFYQNGYFLGEKLQVDMYYSPAEDNFYDRGDRCLRIRTENNLSILSYKHIHNENLDTQYIEEYETQIGDLEMMKCILKALHFKCEIIVEKHRVEFIYRDIYHVAFDEVKDLGYFLEIENRNEKAKISERNQELKALVYQLGLDINKRNQEGYSNMLYRKSKEKKGD